jgi:peroxiredoxin Q/BCP
MTATAAKPASNSPKIGDKAPDFSLPAQDGKTVTLANFKGKNVVIYFYPKDDTPGCTMESKDFRDHMDAFTAANTVILGVSKDSVKSHIKFKEKYCLPFPLLSDEDGNMCEDYDVWKEKSMYGKTYMGIERSTFLIDSAGKIRGAWRKVKVEGHVQEILAAAKVL